MFAPYIDISLTYQGGIASIPSKSGIRALTFAFLIAEGGCRVGWGGVGTTLPDDTFPDGTTVASLVSQLQGQGVQVIISFGGAGGVDPAGLCSSAAALQAVYQSVINRYHVRALDFDIEGAAVADQGAITQRDQALRGLRAANPGLVISYTLPVLPSGLDFNGANILGSSHKDGFSPSVINVMAMDYFQPTPGGMGMAATSAAAATRGQIGSAGLSSSVGITPMIGVNDDRAEVFTLSDASAVAGFARSNGYISRLAMWSVGRDNGGCNGAVSPSCSGISQGPFAFSRIFESF